MQRYLFGRRGLYAAILVAMVMVTQLISPGDVMASDGRQGPWPADVPGYRPVQPGEHPRLLFRRSDLPALRAKAQTPEGRAIIQRLKVLLGGGEAMPEHKRPLGLPFGDKSKPVPQPVGAYSMSHVAGFGLLYQLTGDKKYADLGRQCFEMALEGYRDRDDKARYSFKEPTGALRAGPSLGWYAVGYDLCYDGWDPAFREKIARAIANYNEGRHMSLEELARGKRQHPGSNHWGMQVGGAGLALLAIMNDPGVDMKQIQPLLDDNADCMITNMTRGFGDGGFFAEGDGTGSMASHIAFLTALQAWKTAGGKDFITPRPNAAWLSLKWIFLTIPTGDRSNLRRDFPERGAYPHNIWDRAGLSGGGYFAIGLGALPEACKPAMLWFYNQHLAQRDARAGAPFDTVSVYPHVAVLSFVNWPLDMKPRNPGDVIPHAFSDSKWGFYAWRNRWQDENDTVISILARGTKGNFSVKGENTLTIWSQGQKTRWGGIAGGFKGDFKLAPDGSTILTTGDGSGLAIDFSGASGAEVMLVMTGKGAPRGTTVQAGNQAYSFLFLGPGQAPTPVASGSQVRVGNQTIGWDGKQITLSSMGRP